MKIKPIIILAFALAATGFFTLHAHAQELGYRVIVHKDNPADSITKKELSNLLLKKKSRWGDDLTADPIDLDSKSPVREAFSKDVHGRSVSSIKNYWQRQIFSGKSVPPPEVTSEAEVIDHVKRHPGGIGYVSADARLTGAGVKVLDLSSE